MKFRETSCILSVHKYRDTSLEMMSADVHSMMMVVFMGSMTPRGFADLRTFLHISLTSEGPGVCELPRDSHLHVWVVCREVLHIQFVRERRPPLEDRDGSQEHECMCLHLHDSI